MGSEASEFISKAANRSSNYYRQTRGVTGLIVMERCTRQAHAMRHYKRTSQNHRAKVLAVSCVSLGFSMRKIFRCFEVLRRFFQLFYSVDAE